MTLKYVLKCTNKILSFGVRILGAELDLISKMLTILLEICICESSVQISILHSKILLINLLLVFDNNAIFILLG